MVNRRGHVRYICCVILDGEQEKDSKIYMLCYIRWWIGEGHVRYICCVILDGEQEKDTVHVGENKYK